MKQMLAGLAVAMVLTTGSAHAQQVYGAVKPHWWTITPMGCDSDEEKHWCRAGAWKIHQLEKHGGYDGQLQATGEVYSSKKWGEYLVIGTTFREKTQSVKFRCGNGVAMAMEGPKTSGHGNTRYENYFAWVEMSTRNLAPCLERPLTMTVDGTDYRLSTKLLRQALENVRERQ